MRYTQSEKMEIIRIVEDSELGVNKTLMELGIHKSTFYQRYGKYQLDGYQGLAPEKRAVNSYWNKIPDKHRRQVIEIVEIALELPELSPRQLACHITDNKGFFISESSVYRILKQQGLITSPAYLVMRADKEFKDKTTRVNQMWQTDFTYFKVIGWGWYYLSTVMDDYSRYIISWELCSSMTSKDAEQSIEDALQRTGLKNNNPPRLLSDNGSCYISNNLAMYLDSVGMDHVRGAPNHPQTQGKIERYHRSMKNVIKLELYYSPEELKYRLKEFVDYYNNHRYHESLQNVTPADVYFGRDRIILKNRSLMKQKTMLKRRKLHLLNSSKV
jgi:transposase InsO family protein